MFYLCQHSLQNLGQTVWLDTGMSPCLCLYLVCALCCVLIAAQRRVCVGGGSSHVLRPSGPLSIIVGALACGLTNARHRQTAKRKLWAGPVPEKKKKSSSFSLAQWAVFCAQGSHSLSPLTATVKLCRRYSQWKCSPWHSRVFVWKPFWFVGAISIL